jgi:hypothetical protein
MRVEGCVTDGGVLRTLFRSGGGGAPAGGCGASDYSRLCGTAKALIAVLNRSRISSIVIGERRSVDDKEKPGIENRGWEGHDNIGSI